MRNISAKLPRERYQIDWVDLSLWSKYNDDYAYILNIIDVYSLFCMSRPIKNKMAQNIKDTLASVFYTYGFPQILQSDNGCEFVNILMIFVRKSNFKDI